MKLGGNTNSSTGWSGQLSEVLNTVKSTERHFSFKLTNIEPELIKMPGDVVTYQGSALLAVLSHLKPLKLKSPRVRSLMTSS